LDAGYITVISGIIHNCCTCYEPVVGTVRSSDIIQVLKVEYMGNREREREREREINEVSDQVM